MKYIFYISTHQQVLKNIFFNMINHSGETPHLFLKITLKLILSKT